MLPPSIASRIRATGAATGGAVAAAQEGLTTDETARLEEARGALTGLVTQLARISAEASYKLGVEFDVADPRVARWLPLATFEGMFMRSARSAPRGLLAKAEKAAEGEDRAARRRRKKGEVRQPLVTWDILVASVDADPSTR